MATVAKTSALTISSNQLLTSTLIELFLLSPTQQLYTHLFVQIRSLAHLLKSAMSTSTSGGGGGQSQQQQQQQQSAASTTNTHLKKIYSWWFIWSIEFLSGVLGKGCSQTGSSVSDKKGQLGSLIYPLVQIVLGVMR